MERNLRVGIVGMGLMGSYHAKSIIDDKVPGMKLTGVCDSVEDSVAKWRKRDGVSVFDDFETMLRSGEIEAALIATPHYSHTPLGSAALDAGLHVLVEKPISVHKADCEKLIAAHKNEAKVFAAMFNQRTNPAYAKLKKMIEGGELGIIHRIQWTATDWYRTQSYYDDGGWRATWSGEGGGVLLNQCPHQLDLYQWLFGMPQVVRGFCQYGRFHDIEVEDAVTAYFEHEGGATGTFIASTGEAPGTNRLEVAADRGKIVIDENGFQYLRNEMGVTEHLRTELGKFTKPDAREIEGPSSGDGEQHVGILKNFVEACLEGQQLIAPAAEGIRSVELANSILYSASLDEKLRLPMDSAAYEDWLREKKENSTYRKRGAERASAGEDFSNSS
ncbi:MAG: Gfo/Idh/MocA family oxidoreductase [Verrucomicrobiota bacterium]